jgi:hypothetical protein
MSTRTDADRDTPVSLLDALAVERAVDAGWNAAAEARKAAHQHQSEASQQAVPARGGRSVDARPRSRRPTRQRKKLISRNFAKPSDGLEPSTTSLPLSLAGGWEEVRFPPRLPHIHAACALC